MKTLDPSTEWLDFRAARVQREFLTETHKAHGYHCQPMTNANTHGWEILAPHDIELTWDGIKDSTTNHVKILKGENFENGNKFLDTGTANGTITFDFRAVFETDPDHYLLFLPPSNLFIDGAAPMSALLRSDWYHHNTFQYSWMMTKSDKVVKIPKGTPLVLIINYPKKLLENTEASVRQLNKEELEVLQEYGHRRQKAYEENENFKWLHWYRDGKFNSDSDSVYEKPYKPSPSNPRIIDD